MKKLYSEMARLTELSFWSYLPLRLGPHPNWLHILPRFHPLFRPIGSPRWSRNCKRKTHRCWARRCCWFRFNHLCFWTSSWCWRSCWNWKNWNCRSRRTRTQWFPQEKKIDHYCFNGCWLFHPFCSICTYLKQSIMHLFKTRQSKWFLARKAAYFDEKFGVGAMGKWGISKKSRWMPRNRLKKD